MGKLKDFMAGAVPVTDKHGREGFVLGAEERKQVTNGDLVRRGGQWVKSRPGH